MDQLIGLGNQIKCLSLTKDEHGNVTEMRIGGYGVVFDTVDTVGNPSGRDLQGEFFTAKTYFGAKGGDGVDTVVHHGQAIKAGLEELASRFLAPVKAVKDEVGIFVETVLNMRDAYEARLGQLVQAGKMCWSSGAVSHLVQKKSTGEITTWPIGEFSLTPTPAEPRAGVYTLKSLQEAAAAQKTEGLLARARRIRQAFERTYDPIYEHSTYVLDVWEESLVARIKDEYFKVDYVDDGVTTVFADPQQWTRVHKRVEWVDGNSNPITLKMLEDLATAHGRAITISPAKKTADPEPRPLDPMVAAFAGFDFKSLNA